jgi:hypothetical protein
MVIHVIVVVIHIYIYGLYMNYIYIIKCYKPP